jgi:hypothetical protein
MPRSRDLDTVAPDDPIVSPVPESKPQSTPQPSLTNDPLVSEILGHTTNPLSAFLVFPKVFNFEEKDDNENIILVLRPHWFTNVGWIIVSCLLLFIPTFLSLIPSFANFLDKYHFVFILFWYLITFAYAFEKFLSWYFDVYIITDERIVDIDFNNLLVKKFSEAGLEMIQDTTSNVIGFFPTMFNYGNVLVQTAAEIPEITFENVPNPEKVIKLVQHLREQEVSENDGRKK